MVDLPSSKIKATRVNPKKLILFSKPKVGKTEMRTWQEEKKKKELFRKRSRWLKTLKKGECNNPYQGASAYD